MFKRIWGRARAALCCALCAAVLCACAQQIAGSASSQQDSPADPLTGLSAQYTGQRAVGISVLSTAQSEKQWGISTASVVLEALTSSSGGTGMCLVYPSVEAVPQAGPVAEGQDLFWRVLSAQQVLPVQNGGGIYNRNYLSFYNIKAVDALEVGLNAFSGSGEWNSTPLWSTSGSALSGVLASLNTSGALSAAGKTVVREVAEDGTETLSVLPLLPFEQDAKLPQPTAEDAASVLLRFGSESTEAFAYNAEAAAYGMLRPDGTPQLDLDNGQQAMFDNILVLYSASSLRDDGETLDYDLTVGGGVWLHGGAMYNITWQQGSGSTFVFYDSDGERLAITPGRSYIAIVASLTGEELTVTNSAGGKVG